MTAFDKDTDLSLFNSLQPLHKHSLNCSKEECAFRIALILFHNICSCGIAQQDNLIPAWIWRLLDKHASSGFAKCAQICSSLSPFEIGEFWSTLHSIGKPSYFIHIATDFKLTPNSHNAHISFNVEDELSSIKTTATGKQLIIDSSLLRKALTHSKDKQQQKGKGGKQAPSTPPRQQQGNRIEKKTMKCMLYNNHYKKWIDRIFVRKESFCKEYLAQQCQTLYHRLSDEYAVPDNLIKYCINHLLLDSDHDGQLEAVLHYEVNDNPTSSRRNVDESLDGNQLQAAATEESLKNEPAKIGAGGVTVAGESDSELFDAIDVINTYNKKQNRLPLNTVFGGLDLAKFVNLYIRRLMDYSSESNRNDEQLHTFQILSFEDKEWLSDCKRAGCAHQQCSVFFDCWQRRHHCRGCGEIYCSEHLSYHAFKRNTDHDAVGHTNKLRKSRTAQKAQHKQSVAQLQQEADTESATIPTALIMAISDEERVKVCEKCKEFYWYFVYKSPNNAQLQGIPHLI
eukprot:CAMPEP_0197023320 /NCGR_PEP_ID=MMETSP1384-20130603/4043_1 /TAXON_ID=29189 /ORGANISM="Ammonia sp." /LENGTH=510 /DNA_ID=CAMNT_0042451515 /DNA_START=38 /DNA_END=1570 /DNA_ORIENTATION=-